MTSLAALLGLEVAALLALHHLGSYEATAIEWGNLSGWLSRAAPENALVAVVRLATLALAWWLAASTLLYVLAGVTRIPALVRGVRWATVAPVRRMIDGALATTIVVGSTFATTGVTTASPAVRTAVVVQIDETEGEAAEASRSLYQTRPARDSVQSEYQPTPAGDGLTPPPSATGLDGSSPATPPKIPRAEASPVPSPGTYVVRPGDSLWSITEQNLASATGRSISELDPGEVRASWLRLVEINGNRVQSGDADLIFPGEHLIV